MFLLRQILKSFVNITSSVKFSLRTHLYMGFSLFDSYHGRHMLFIGLCFNHRNDMSRINNESVRCTQFRSVTFVGDNLVVFLNGQLK